MVPLLLLVMSSKGGDRVTSFLWEALEAILIAKTVPPDWIFYSLKQETFLGAVLLADAGSFSALVLSLLLAKVVTEPARLREALEAILIAKILSPELGILLRFYSPQGPTFLGGPAGRPLGLMIGRSLQICSHKR